MGFRNWVGNFMIKPEIASQDFPEYTGPRTASYDVLDDEGARIQTGTDADGNPIFEQSRLTEDERAGMDLLRRGEDTYKSYLDDSKAMADQLGSGFTEADTDELIGGSFTYDDFDTARAGQYQDVFQTSIDPAIEELNRQRDLRQSQNTSDAIRACAFGGSRLGLREATTDAEIARAGSDLRRSWQRCS